MATMPTSEQLMSDLKDQQKQLERSIQHDLENKYGWALGRAKCALDEAYPSAKLSAPADSRSSRKSLAQKGAELSKSATSKAPGGQHQGRLGS